MAKLDGTGGLVTGMADALSAEGHDEQAETGAHLDRLVDATTHFDVAQFLVHEASLLDARKFVEWHCLLAEDFVYDVPIPVTRDNPGVATYADQGSIVHESHSSLAWWIRRHEPDVFEYAWGENPPQRTRHLVTNVTVRHRQGVSDEYDVESYVLLGFSKQSEPETLATALRRDVLRRTGTDWRLASRTVLLNQMIHTLSHMRLIF
jgi:3-phenylpropionate/cinnamic acid dioxygenase small subunit